MRTDDSTRLSYWFPLVQAAGLPVPRTRIVSLSDEEFRDFSAVFDGKTPECWERLMRDIRAAAEGPDGVGVPFFLRTDFTSNKHNWEKSCHVSDLERIGHYVYDLAEFSEMADMFGGMPPDTFVVRELLPTNAVFTAFWGKMPIAREFRFFVRDGYVEHWQPYWPPESIEGHDPSVAGWRDVLDEMSQLSNDAFQRLVEMTLRVSAAVPGFWSVDWLQTTDRGWVLTDMAEGEKSYRWVPTWGAR